jgi:hypothetical protein
LFGCLLAQSKFIVSEPRPNAARVLRFQNRLFAPHESAEKPMSARKIKRLEAGRSQRQLTPPKAEMKTWARAGALLAADAAASPDSKASARGPAGDSRAAPAPTP